MTSYAYDEFTTEEYGDLISQYDGNDTLYHQYDGLGSTDALLDEWETATDRYAHRAFGLEAARTGTTDNPFTYVGRQSYYKDPELELYLLGARYYDPGMGRFISKDPIGFGSGDANLYRYVGNGATIDTDPSGKEGLVSNTWNNIVWPYASDAAKTYAYVTLLPFTGLWGPGYQSYTFCRNVHDDPVGTAKGLAVDYVDTVAKPLVVPYREGARWYFGAFYASGTPEGDLAAELSARDGRDVVIAGGAFVAPRAFSGAPRGIPEFGPQSAGAAQSPRYIPGYGYKGPKYWGIVKRLQAGESVQAKNLRMAGELRRDAFPDLVRNRYRGPLSQAPDLRGTYDWHNPQRMPHPGPHQTPHIQIKLQDGTILRIEVRR